MGLLREMYFSAEAYKMALDINERVKRVYRIMGPGQIINSSNAYQIAPDVRWLRNQIASLREKAETCSGRVQFIKVPTPDGYEIPVTLYIVNMEHGLNMIRDELSELGY